ncbi:MAG TPA: protein kinase [Planctomycetota bacterium]|nr:protein kinase [Planctomycetota bacterium]
MLTDECELDLSPPPPAGRANLPRIDGIVLTHLLGQGGMGMVYKGFHLRLSIPVAVKFLRNALHTATLVQEAQLAATINHLNVVRVYDVHRENDLAYTVQEYVQGSSLFCLIEQNVRQSRFLPEQRLLEIAADIARGLAAIHAAGIVHLDIKPENVLLDERTGTAKIADLGLARRMQKSAHATVSENSGDVLGTPGFMSPEQMMGSPAGAAADVYALGALLYELAVNRTPFNMTSSLAQLYIEQNNGRYTSPRKYRSDLSSGSLNIISRCLCPDPAQRFADGAELLAHIQQALAALQDTSPRSGQHVESRQGARVVCMSHDPNIREFLSDVLGDAGHSVACLATSREALMHLAAHGCDVILLDVDMQGGDGIKVFRLIRTLPGRSDTPVVFITGNSDSTAIETARKLGAADYLLKPLGAGDLLARVDCLWRLCRVEQERQALEAQCKKMSARYSAFRAQPVKGVEP